MNKRIYAVIMALALVLGLTACCLEHEWTEANCVSPRTCAACEETEGEALGHSWADATCEAPRTCSACGETEGEALGHSWADATCEAAKTCSVCAATEGDALGHSWVDATYQTPKTCTVCGAAEGEALVAGYIEHAMAERLLDKTAEYDLTVPCYSDETQYTIGKLTVDSYEIFASDETHEAMDGYEWRVMVLRIRFSDENATSKGVGAVRYMSDDYYYTGKATEQPEDGTNHFELEWNGAYYGECTSQKIFDATDWLKDENGNYYLDCIITFSYRVPIGYDGVVVGVSPAAMDWPVGTSLYEVIDDTARLFRMD